MPLGCSIFENCKASGAPIGIKTENAGNVIFKGTKIDACGTPLEIVDSHNITFDDLRVNRSARKRSDL